MRRWLLLCLAFTACVDDPAEPTGPTVVSGSVVHWSPVYVNRQVDLLLVIDNSPAMAAHADRLRENYRRFGEVLGGLARGVPELHLGVVTTDLGTQGARGEPGAPIGVLGEGGCAGAGDAGRLRTVPAVRGDYLVDTVAADGTRLRNYDGSLGDAIAQLADAGSGGCAFVQPLEAARRALTHPDNRGFLREDAYLAIIIISANDDCSFADASFLVPGATPARCIDHADLLVPTTEHERFLKVIKGDPGRVIVGGALASNGGFLDGQTRSLRDACGDATRPRGRLASFLDRFVNRSTSVSLCDADLSPVLGLVGQLFRTSLGVPCWDGPLVDVEPDVAGEQHACNVWYRFGEDGAHGSEIIPACGTTLNAGPCWRMERDDQVCPDAYLLAIDQPRVDIPPSTLLISECLTR